MAATAIDPGFQQQLDRMFASAPKTISVISGFRTTDEQQALRDKAETAHPGDADRWAAKPGTSWHEFGLAADLHFADPGTLQWAHDHAAEFGLFFPMSWEPWHVQPLWTEGRKPSATSDATGGTTIPPATVPPDQEQKDIDPMGKIFGSLTSMIRSGADTANHPAIGDGLTIGQRWANLLHPPTATGGYQTSVGQGATPNINPAGYTGDFAKAYQLIIDEGGTPEEARILAAIAGPESGYDTHAHNDNADTGDDSYGWWQINMRGDLGPSRRQTYGLSSNDDLYDPKVNARIALDLARTQGVQNAWATTYNNGSYKKYLPAGATV